MLPGCILGYKSHSAQQETVSAEINRLRIAIRRKNHRVRNEKTYTTRVQQFLRFNAQGNGVEVDSMSEGKVAYYIDSG